MLRSIVFLLAICCAISCESQKKEADNIKSGQLTIQKDTIPAEAEPEVSIEFLTGKFDPANHPDFVIIDPSHTDKTGIYLQKEVYSQFLKMREAAAKDGIQLIIRSATRNFDAQKRIWERKWQALEAKGRSDEKEMALEILQYSSMPGTSRHHWGTDMDLNSVDNQWFGSPEGQKLYKWLVEHAGKFGFCQPYTAKGTNRPDGYEEEKWHWSYLPLSKIYVKAAEIHLNDDLISGFKGSNTARDIGVVRKYVLGIDPQCK